MVCEALKPYQRADLRPHFVSNVDGAHLVHTLARLDPRRTLFIVASKTFTTQETMTNAESARSWLTAALGEAAVAQHFVAVSTNAAEVARFGIDAENMFAFWDWVGGRYSLWSAIGLPIALAVGYERFLELLAGAHAMDEHFRTAPLEHNMPVVLALIGVWYRNFLGAATHGDPALRPASPPLPRLSPAGRHGEQRQVRAPRRHPGRLRHRPDRLGRAGHQRAARLLPAHPPGHRPRSRRLHRRRRKPDAARRPPRQAPRQLPRPDRGAGLRQDRGGGAGRARRPRPLRARRSSALLPHKVFDGNRPSTSILYRRLTPAQLGALVALYEHKIFVQGVIWNINSYDQWGVELGKQLASRILPELEGGEPARGHDSSTNGLLDAIRRLRGGGDP